MMEKVGIFFHEVGVDFSRAKGPHAASDRVNSHAKTAEDEVGEEGSVHDAVHRKLHVIKARLADEDDIICRAVISIAPVKLGDAGRVFVENDFTSRVVNHDFGAGRFGIDGYRLARAANDRGASTQQRNRAATAYRSEYCLS
jgi:hypothetical protein